mgnify:CR=1 FL=1
MEITHETKMTAVCPNEGHVNNYTVKIKVNTFIEVELLIDLLDSYVHTRIFQEDLTSDLCIKLLKIYRDHYRTRPQGSIELKGKHLGVMITSKEAL